MKKIFKLFAVFFKIGLFTFGGGYAMISVIQRECERNGWATKEDILEMVTLAESTPGVIAVNSATFIGYKVAGFWGSLLATIGVVLPSFVIISSLYFILDAVIANVYVAAAFAGMRACISVLIFRAFVALFALGEKHWLAYVLFVCAFAYATFTSWSVIYLLIAVLAAGSIMGIIKSRRQAQ